MYNKSKVKSPTAATQAIIYQAKSGAIELRGDLKKQTLWADLLQIAELFDIDKSGISRHIHNIFRSKELEQSSTVAKIATVQKEGARSITRTITYYNLDVILSVGYKVNSKKATVFRQWATKILHQHIVAGYTINRSRIAQNYDTFLQAVADVKTLLPADRGIDVAGTLELTKLFAHTWLSLEAYDQSALPKIGSTKKQVQFAAEELTQALAELKRDLIKQRAATNLFGQEKAGHSLAGIIGNIFQSFSGQPIYPTIEEQAAHLLYFIVKNHPFVDCNKRSGAFAFVWFLRKTKLLNINRMTPEALTALTLLVAESHPQTKDRLIGLILILLNKSNRLARRT